MEETKLQKDDCLRLLKDKYNELQRYPKRSDFNEREVVAIKAFLGPWPRALEAAGIKPQKKTKKFITTLSALLLIATAVVIYILTNDFRKPEDYYDNEFTKANPVGTVQMSIRCDEVAGRNENIPESGIILEMTELEIAEGDTVYTILTDAARKYKLQLESSGTGDFSYISGINYIYEFDFGDLSGWTYTVNKEQPLTGASSYVLKDGDVIEWQYLIDLSTIFN